MTEIVLEQKANDRAARIQALLDSEFVNETNAGFEIDVAKLVKDLSKEQKQMLAAMLLNQ